MLQPIVSGLYACAGITPSRENNKIAAFDLDWTIIRSIHGIFPKSSDDWAFLPNRITTLKAYSDAGYTLAIFTNQGYSGAKLNIAIDRVNNVITALNTQGINPWVFVSTSKDIYRKPNIGMWQVLEKSLPQTIEKEISFYCGDAAGRSSDHSSDDILFASNIGVPFYTPEQIFPQNIIIIPETQTMFIFVGMPGSGKTTYYTRELQSRGWIHINQDTLKTRSKVLAATRKALLEGKSVAIDATNPDPIKRKDFIDMAIEYQIPTIILYFVGNGYNINKLRPNPVPTIAYNVYFKNLIEPTQELDHVPVVQII